MKYSDSVKAILLAAIDNLAAAPEKYVKNPGRDFTLNRKLSFKHLRLIACNGSALNIFRHTHDPDTFYEPSRSSPKGYNQAYINACYSILGRRFTDLIIQPGRIHNEYSAFCQMVDAAGPRQASSPAAIYLCARGYASYNNFAHVMEHRQYFLIRCTDTKTEGILGRSLDGVEALDTHVERILSRSQSKKKRAHPEFPDRYRHICRSVPMDYLTNAKQEYNISLRVVRFELSPCFYENLITNLPDHEFDMDDFKELYHLRWSQENAYRDIKYPLYLKALHSKKYAYVAQEILLKAILYNFCSKIALNVEIEQNGKKYKYQMNYSKAVKTYRVFYKISIAFIVS